MFFTWNATENNPTQKPTTLGLTHVQGLSLMETRCYDDMDLNEGLSPLPWDRDGYIYASCQLELSERQRNGILDLSGADINDDQGELAEYFENDNRFMIAPAPIWQTDISLYFNLRNPIPQPYNVRKAIAYAIDKTAMADLNLNIESVDSPIWKANHAYYDDSYKIPFDCNIARDLMIDEGVSPARSCALPPVARVGGAPTVTIPNDLPMNFQFFIFSLLMLPMTKHIRKQKI